MKNTYCVYKHTNKINGKIYFGLTVHGDCPEKRWGKNGNGYAPKNGEVINNHFYAAILKYGWDNFDHIIILNNLNKNDACKLELYYIKEYDTRNPEKGYNISIGGENGSIGLVWCNNDIIECYSTENNIPEGFTLGRLNNLSKETRAKLCTSKDKIWCNNGENEFYINSKADLPVGYDLGRLSISEEARQNLKASFTKERRELLSLLMIGKEPYNKGKHAYYNSEGKCKYFESTPDTGYISLCPEELRKKHSEASKNNKSTSGMSWYNNGTENKMFLPTDIIPDEFVPGKLLSEKENALLHKKREYYYDSNGNKVAIYEGEEIPEGLTKNTPQEIHDRYSKLVVGENNPMYGKKQKDSTKALISAKAKGRNIGEKNGAYGRKWYHDEIVRVYIKGECPPGFKPGYKRGELCLKTDEEINNYIKEKNYG